MTNRQLRRAGLVLALALTALGPNRLQAQECEDVSGAWDLTIDLPDGNTQDVTLTMEQTECAVTGLVEGNNQTPIEDGKVEGSTFTFRITVDGGGQMITFVWEGTVDGEDVSGTWSADMVGTLEFSGTRAGGGRESAG